VTAFYGLEGGILTMADGIPVYPKGGHVYGLDVMGAHTAHWQSKVVISLVDAWVLDPRAISQAIHWVPWFPVDMEPLPPPVRDKVKFAYKRIVFSRFAEGMVKNENLTCYYVPHGIDTNVYQPLEQKLCREALRWPQDKFIIGMVAANKGLPSRKAFQPQLEAFARLKKKHSDVLLYMHTAKGDGGVQMFNLPEFCQFLGLKHGTLGVDNPDAVDVLFAEPYQNMLGYPEEFMVQMYSALDVHLLVSMGEGFGIPILEAQACGCPVITGDWTAMSEITFAGWKVAKEDAVKIWTPLAAYQYQPRDGAILEQLEKAYIAKGRRKFREQAREGALAFDADLVTQDYWKPVLFDIFQEINKPDVLPTMNLVKF
jgi:glycosyltransferase involved in cell wall biosynthesis